MNSTRSLSAIFQVYIHEIPMIIQQDTMNGGVDE